MTFKIPGAAKALAVLTAAGLLLGGCYYHRPHHGGPVFAAPHYGKHYHHGKGGKRDYGHHRRDRHERRGRGGWR